MYLYHHLTTRGLKYMYMGNHMTKQGSQVHAPYAIPWSSGFQKYMCMYPGNHLTTRGLQYISLGHHLTTRDLKCMYLGHHLTTRGLTYTYLGHQLIIRVLKYMHLDHHMIIRGLKYTYLGNHQNGEKLIYVFMTICTVKFILYGTYWGIKIIEI